MKKTALLAIPVVLILLSHSDSAGQERPDKRKEIASTARIINDMGGDLMGYSSEILTMLENSYGIKLKPPADDIFDEIDRSDVQAEHTDLYSIFSGGLTLRKSLQLETVTAPDEKNGTIDPASLSSPVMKQIHYSEMLQGKKYRIYTIDRYAPAEFYYLHFSDAGKTYDVLNYIEEKAATLRRRISAVSADFMTRSRITTQLALKEEPSLKQFYSSVIDEMVITGSDPFIIEGSDVTLILRPQNRDLLLNRITEYRKEFKTKYSCEEKKISASEVTGTILFSPGGEVRSCMFLLLDGTIIISNSLKASEIVIDTALGRHISLAESPDYLYTRSIFPAKSEDEDAFLYISDLFVKHLSSPVLKITEARRMKEAMRMSVLEKYAIYYYMLNGKKGSSVEDIASAPGTTSLNDSRKKELAAIKKNPSYKRARDLESRYRDNWEKFESKLSTRPPAKKGSRKKRRRDTGAGTLTNAMKVFYRNMTGSSAKSPEDVLTLIDSCGKPGGFNSKRFEGLSFIKGTFTALSSVYGRIGYMTPCIDIATGMVTEREAENYRDFARDYRNTGEAYISPAGIKVSLRGNITNEAFVFRTEDNPFYSLISAFAGGPSVTLHPDSTVKGDLLSLAVKLEPSAIERYFALNDIKLPGKNKKQIAVKDLLAGEIQLHMGDSLPPAGFNPSALRQIMNGGGYGYTDAVSGLMVWSLLHPVRLAVPVKESDSALAAIESIRKQLADRWNSGNMVRCDTFSFVYSGVEVKVLRMTILGSLTARVYSTVKNRVLHIATTEKYIKSILDLQPQPRTSIAVPLIGNAAIVVRPSEMSQEQDMYRSDFIEDAMLKSMKNFGTIKLMSLLYPEASAAELPKLAFRNFGFRPVCPLGGEYNIDRKSGEVVNSVFGTYTAPSIRNSIKRNGAVQEGIGNFFNKKEIRAELEFIPDGMKLKFSTK